MHRKWVFRTIQAPDRLEFMTSFADAQGNTIRAPFAGTWPLEMLTVVPFDAHAGKGHGTVITVRSSAYRADAAEQRTLDDGHESMRGGWGGTSISSRRTWRVGLIAQPRAEARALSKNPARRTPAPRPSTTESRLATVPHRFVPAPLRPRGPRADRHR